jgi:hypothetical protein
MALLPATAGAYQDPGWYASQSTGNQHAIMDFLYDEGPQGVTPYAGDPATQATGMVNDLLQESPGDAGYGDLAAQLTRSEGVLGLIPETPPLAAPIPAALALEAFGAGWLIGTGANELFLHIGLPDGSAPSAPPGDFCYSAACGGELSYRPYGAVIYYGATVQQSPGAYLYYGEQGGFSYTPARWFEQPCPFSGFSAPPDSRMQTGVASGVQCAYGTYGELRAPVSVDYPYVTVGDLEHLDMLHRYNQGADGSPTFTSPAPPDPGISTTEQRAQNALDGENPTLRAWLAWENDPNKDPAEDPEKNKPGTGYDDNDPCNPNGQGIPRYEPVRKPGSTETDPRTSLEQDFPDSVGADGQPTTVHLYWGTLLGFGYRHIAYKHGWGSGDIASTAEALQTLPTVEGDTATYRDVYTGTGGVSCSRVVVVGLDNRDPSFAPPPDNVPAPKGIITSYHQIN